MKFTARLTKSDPPLWGFLIMLPDPIAQSFININKELRNKLGLKTGMKVDVELKKDKSKYLSAHARRIGRIAGTGRDRQPSVPRAHPQQAT